MADVIVNVHRERERLEPLAGRVLQETFDLVGTRIRDLDIPKRIWTINSFLAPLPGRMIGGVRARLVDQKGFVTFLNQRDLEVMLKRAEPGERCPWLGSDYESPFDHRRWIGFLVDGEDMEDDLFIREADLRVTQTELTGGNMLPTGFEITRLLHLNEKTDVEELLYLRGDFDPATGLYPDTRLETIGNRWVSVERRAVRWPEI